TAKAARKGLWANYVEPSAEEEIAEQTANIDLDKRPSDYRNIEVTTVLPDGRLKLQINAPTHLGKLADLHNRLRKDPAIALTEVPKRNTILAARFSEDKQLYRARVTAVDRTAANVKVQVNYIDYG